MRRRDVLKGVALGAASLALPKVVIARPASVLRYMPGADLAVLDPLASSAFVTCYHANLAFDTLFGQDTKFNPHPQMVDGYVVENDGKLWRLVLRDGLKFHDGEPVLARDCVASIKRWGRADAFGQALMAVTNELTAASDKEIVFRLSRPFPLLPAALGKSSTYVPVIMPERQALQSRSQLISDPVGSGPYRYIHSERVPGQLTVYEKFADYQPRADGVSDFTSGPKIAHIDRVEWRWIPDHATAASALQANEIDWWEAPLVDLLPLLESDPNIVIDTIGELGDMGIVRFNHLQPPFDRPEMRRAFAKMVSQTEMMQAMAGRTWDDNVGFFTPESPMASMEGLPIAQSEPNFAEIKASLAAVGYKGEKITVLDPPSSYRIHTLTSMLVDQMKRAGLNVDVVALDYANWAQRRTNRDTPENGGWNLVATLLPGQELWDPAGHIALRGNGGDAWPGWPTSPGLESLRDEWLQSPDEAARADICRRMQRQAIQDLPYVPAGRWTTPTAYRKGLTGVSRHIPIFYNLKIER